MNSKEAAPVTQQPPGSTEPGVPGLGRVGEQVSAVGVTTGYLTARGDTDGGTWLARPRFRYAVAALCEDSDLYVGINGLEGGMPDGGEGHAAGSLVHVREHEDTTRDEGP
jgi:hypothetical protein